VLKVGSDNQFFGVRDLVIPDLYLLVSNYLRAHMPLLSYEK
jgi:hypothetical protein